MILKYKIRKDSIVFVLGDRQTHHCMAKPDIIPLGREYLMGLVAGLSIAGVSLDKIIEDSEI